MFFRPGSDLISLLILLFFFLFLLGSFFKTASGSVISNRTRIKFGRIFLRVNARQLWIRIFDVLRWRPWRHFMKKCCHLVSAWTRSVCRSPCSSVPPVPDISLYQIRTCFIIFWTPRFSVSRLHIFVGLTPPLFYTCGAVIRYDQTDYCGINFVSVLSHRLCLFDVYMRSFHPSICL